MNKLLNNKLIIITLLLVAMAPFLLYVLKDNNSINPYQIDNSVLSSQTIARIDFQKPAIETPMESGSQFDIMSIEIKDGYRYNILLNNGRMIEAQNTVATKEEAIPVVIEMFKASSEPKVILHRLVDNYWIVSIYLDLNNERNSLTYFLAKKDLTY